jgi:hypothetical protein
VDISIIGYQKMGDMCSDDAVGNSNDTNDVLEMEYDPKAVNQPIEMPRDDSVEAIIKRYSCRPMPCRSVKQLLVDFQSRECLSALFFITASKEP